MDGGTTCKDIAKRQRGRVGVAAVGTGEGGRKAERRRARPSDSPSREERGVRNGRRGGRGKTKRAIEKEGSCAVFLLLGGFRQERMEPQTGADQKDC